MWEYSDTWWSVLPNDSGTWLWRLDNTGWNPTLRLSSSTSAHADVKAVGDLAHVLLYDGSTSELITVQYSTGAGGGYAAWPVHPALVDVSLTSGVETATIDVDSTGRLWLATDASSSIEVRYSDFPYTSFSSPFTIASGITSDDIAAIAAFPGGAVGVLWSDQNTDRFGFRLHLDSDLPTSWLGDEVPASQSALSVGGGMADDHLNMAVASDGTLYAAVKTSYDTGGYAKIALLVRRPSGNWDPLYTVDTRGTRPIVVLNEDAGRLIVAYSESESGGDILFRESPLDAISFGQVGTLIGGNVNNATSTKGSFDDDLVVLAGDGKKVYGSLIRWPQSTDGTTPPAQDAEPTPVDLSAPVTVSFQDGLSGYTGTQDASILAGSAKTNFGTAAELQVDGSPDEATLIRWDLSAIAPGNLIQAATITLNVTNTSAQTYEIYQLLRGWSESQTTWNQASAGVAWQTAGAQGTGDRGSAVLGTITASSLGQYVISLNAAGLAAVQQWVDQPESNYGLIVQDYVSATNGVMFNSSEASNVSLRPKLTLTYQAAAPADTEPDPLPLIENQPPQVDAGADRQVELPAAVALDGKVQDDGLPASPGAVSIGWSKVSGPGTVEFANSAAAQTTATFSQPGTYVLRLTAADGQLTAADDLTVLVSAPPTPVDLSAPVTVSFQDGLSGYTGTQDASILAGSAKTNFGTAAELQVDGSPDEATLIRWDLSAIAPGNLIQAATITLNVTNTSPQTYEIYQLLRGWSESQTTWNQASAGVAWQTAGAQGTGDRGSAVLGTITASSLGQYVISLNAAGLAAVQQWVDQPESNYGLIVQDYVSATNGVMFNSSEASNVSLRPKLTLTYQAPAPADTQPDPLPLIENQPPQVDAGADRQVELPAAVALDGKVEDDGLPASPGAVSIGWSKVSGPGTVEFANSAAAQTTATFSQPGTYVLRLTAADGQLTAADDLTVLVSAPPTPVDLSAPVTVSFQDGLSGYTGTQDASILAGSAKTNFGTAAELQVDGSPDEATLIRWDLSAIAPGNLIQAATITLNVTNTSPQTYEIYQLLRGWSESQTTWNQASAGVAWQTAGAQGTGDRGSAVLGTITASSLGQYVISLNAAGLAAVQQWVDQPESNYGLIVQDYVSATNGVMFNSSEASNVSLRPKLTLTYQAPAPADTQPDPLPLIENQPPQVDAGADRQVELPAAVALDGKVEDDGLPASPGAVSIGWSKVSGPGTVEFANSAAAQTTATFSQPGTYVLRLTAADGQLTAADDLTVLVSAPPTPTSGLAALLRLDETAGTAAFDSSGLGNDGSIHGDPTHITGQSGNALYLNGSNDYVVVPDSPSLDARDAITLSAWLRPEQVGTQYVVKKAAHGTVDGYEMTLSENGTVFVRFNNASAGNNYRVDSQTLYPTDGNTWIHVAATYDGSTIKLYINGKLESSQSASFQIGVNDLGLGIGAEENGYRPMRGTIDEVRVYTRALSDAEIQDLATV